MGKKGGKKGNLDNDVENAEPSLSVIQEEDHGKKDENPEDDQPRKSQIRSPKTSLCVLAGTSKSKSILKPYRQSTISNTSKTLMIAEPREQMSMSASVPILVDEEEYGEIAEVKKKKGKEKKGKKGKKEKTDSESKEDVGDGEAKAGKKGKKEKKEKADKGEQTDETEKKGKKGGKGKKEKPSKESKETQKDDVEDGDERELTHGTRSRSDNRLRNRQSRVSFHQPKMIANHDAPRQSIPIPAKEASPMMLQEEETHKQKRRSNSRTFKGSNSSQPVLTRGTSASRSRLSQKSSSKVGLSVDPHGRRGRYASISGFSTDTDFSSDSSDTSSRIEKEERGKKKKKKGKKDKKEKKKEQEEEKEKEPETEEEIQKKKEEKKVVLEAKKAEKREAKLAAKIAKREAAAAAAATKKAEKPGVMDYEDVKKNLEELIKIAKGLGVELVEETGEEKGPKKKMSKKEKARLTAEMAEKQKAAMEAETKRIEELIKKKKEEDRLAAIEKDKKDIMEQGFRMEQLKTSDQIIHDIMETNAEIVREEKELLEWQKYVECGYLPNPIMVNQMNTYLHRWELILDTSSMDVASKKSTDAIQLLNDLDELIDTVTKEEEYKLKNWKWIRQLFREYQAASLDVATYRLIRDVEHNLNRINIPTADFNFQDQNVTLCLWLRVMLPIPLPNPRRPPKSRIDISFNLMNVHVLFPITIDCNDAAIRAMYLKYDHLSDLCNTFDMPEVPKDYHMDLLEIERREWRNKLKYKYENRDKKPKQRGHHVQLDIQEGVSTSENVDHGVEDEGDDPSDHFDSDEEIPTVPFKQLKPTANAHAVLVEDKLYENTRAKLTITVPEQVLNLRKFVILGGVYHLHLLAQPPQPQDFITMEMTITGLSLPKKLEVLPFKVVYTPYVPPEPELPPPGSTSSLARKLPEEIEEEMKKQEEELDKLISIEIKWPQHVIFLELPIVCRWDEELKHWSKEEIHDLKHNEEKCILSFRTGVFGIYGLAAYRYVNLPFQAYDIKPETDLSITVQLTAAILMLEFNIKDGLISITQLQNSPNMTLQNVVGKYFKLHKLIRMMKDAGIDIFPSFDAFCYVDGCCEKQWAMEKHLYYNMAQMANSFNFAWSRWNLQAGRRKIVLQMRQYAPESKKQKGHQMLLVTPRKASFIECTEVSQTFSNKDVESMKPVVGPNGVVQDKMSLNTLLEAAKFLEMQEQRQQHRATLETALTTATIRPVTAINGGATHFQNGNNGGTQTITLQPVKLINATTAPTSIGTLQNHQPQPTQTVVISSNNISSTFLQGVQGPITFTTASPTSATTSPQTIIQNGVPQNCIPQTKKEQDGHISSTTMSQTQRHRVLNNSFDIMNPLVIDEGSSMEQKKIKQPPMVFRSGTREVHNKLEKHRRAHLKECFDILKKQLPTNGEEKKTSNLSILHSALRYIQNLKRRERELEHEMERLAREKISHQQRLATLKKDISTHFDNVDFSKILPEIPSSTTSITQNGGMGIKRDSGDGLVSTSSSNFIIPTSSVATPISIEPMKIDHTPTIVTSSEFGNVATVVSSSTVINQTNSVIASTGDSKISIPILGKVPIVTTTQATTLKEMTQPVQTTGISVLPMPYPVNQGLVLQKVAIVPHKGLTDLAPLMSTTHFITTPQQLNGINGQINGKVVPLTQYIVKPMVVVSSANPRPGS